LLDCWIAGLDCGIAGFRFGAWIKDLDWIGFEELGYEDSQEFVYRKGSYCHGRKLGVLEFTGLLSVYKVDHYDVQP
jgi:hypothetical protein